MILDHNTGRLGREVAERSGEDVGRCYQCGKCSAGCPMEAYMEMAPHQVIRLVQLGQRDDVLDSGAIWLCASCFTCTTRCPMEFDLARAMDALRHMAFEVGRKPPEGKILAFHKAFLNQVRSHGRLFEFGLIGEYKLRTGAFLQDADVARPMLLRRKLKFFPGRIAGRGEIKRIFDRANAGTSSRRASL